MVVRSTVLRTIWQGKNYFKSQVRFSAMAKLNCFQFCCAFSPSKLFIILLSGAIVGAFAYNSLFFFKNSPIFGFYRHSNFVKSEVASGIQNRGLRCLGENTEPKLHVQWKPRQDSYVVAACTTGQLSNRISCFRRTLVVASILNRTLIIPNEDLWPFKHKPYRFDIIFDFQHARHCLGENTIYSQQEYLLLKRKNSSEPIHIDRVLCLFSRCNWKCNYKKWRTLKLPKKFVYISKRLNRDLTVEKFARLFKSINDEVITFGDLFKLSEFFDYTMLVPYTMRKRCKIIIKPHRAVLKAARGFIREVLGSRYASMHLRRTDFSSDDRIGNNLWSTMDVAKCIYNKLELYNVHLLFIATDTFDEEITLLENALHSVSRPMGFPITVVKLPDMRNKRWADELDELNLANDSLAISVVEKVVASLSFIFFGTNGSTFSHQISEMRELLGLPTCHDEIYCHAQNWDHVNAHSSLYSFT